MKSLLDRISAARPGPDVLPPYIKTAPAWAKEWGLSRGRTVEILAHGIKSKMVRMERRRVQLRMRLQHVPVYIDVAAEQLALARAAHPVQPTPSRKV